DIKYNISDMLSIMDYDDLDDRIKSALVNVFNAYDNKLTTDEPKSVDSLVEKFNEAYKEHIEKEAQENQGKDTDEHLETETGSKIDNSKPDNSSNQTVKNNNQVVQNNSSNQLVEKPNTMTTYEWLKYLLDNNPDIDRNNVSVKIAIDIMERNVDRLSYKQQYRVNDAIRICEKANKNRLKVADTSNTSSKETQNTDDSTYEVYELDEKPDIKNIVNELISKANSVEMSKVLEEYPNVIKICYSVLGRNKVSTRQLKHINGAYAMIKNQ
ncbi:MAG: hypothetical protein IJ593_00650, partial [Lachnospiraceae bacterium]|nr:hypothetical protein [Lachnospiraceae bacterium]